MEKMGRKILSTVVSRNFTKQKPTIITACIARLPHPISKSTTELNLETILLVMKENSDFFL
jgi:hypothetical protein